jgi:hypothetical protein
VEAATDKAVRPYLSGKMSSIWAWLGGNLVPAKGIALPIMELQLLF